MLVQGSLTISLAMAADENVYTTRAWEAQLAIKVNTVLGAGGEQELKDSSNFLSLHITTFQSNADGRQFEF